MMRASQFVTELIYDYETIYLSKTLKLLYSVLW